MRSIFDGALDTSWLDAALDAWVSIEETQARRAVVREVAREMVAICRSNRERVERAEALLDRHGAVIPHAHRQEILRLMAELLLYIQYGGVRMKCSGDPLRVLRGEAEGTG